LFDQFRSIILQLCSKFELNL